MESGDNGRTRHKKLNSKSLFIICEQISKHLSIFCLIFLIVLYFIRNILKNNIEIIKFIKMYTQICLFNHFLS